MIKAVSLAEWASKNSIDFELVGVAEIPDTGDDTFPQNEEFWELLFDALPLEEQIPAGKYLYYYASDYAFFIEDEKEQIIFPDAEIKLRDCDDRIFLYRLDA